MRKLLFLFTLVFISTSCQSQNGTIENTVDMDIVDLVKNRQLDKVKLALEQGANVNSTDSSNNPLILIATLNKDNAMANLLVDYKADVNLQGNNLDSAFLYAGASGQTQLVELYLNNGAKFDVFNRYNGSALIPASEKGHIETVKLLANWPGYPVNHVNRLGWTALMEAVVLGDGSKTYQDVIQILLDASADKNIPDSKGVSALTHAKRMGYTKIAQMLED
ncbi:ankyrin repeat domain-containing protein [Myroides sp. LJL115]